MLMAFSMSGASLAASTITLGSIDGGSYDASTQTVTATAGQDTVFAYWTNFSLEAGDTFNFAGSGINFLNEVGNQCTIAGTINAFGNNLTFIAPQGLIVKSTAVINANSLLMTTLPLKVGSLATLTGAQLNNLRNDMKIAQALEFAVKNAGINTRYGILVNDGATMTVTNRLDLVSAKIIRNVAGDDLASSSPNRVYTTTDGITFALASNGAVDSISSSTGIPAGKMVLINSRPYYTKYTPPIDPPEDPTSPDPLLPLSRLMELKQFTPTPQDLDLTDMPLNLAGTQMRVAPLDETKLVNNINPSEFSQDSVGAIAINNSADHMIAVNEFTPIGAAAQVGNNNPNEQQYDFVIQTPILE